MYPFEFVSVTNKCNNKLNANPTKLKYTSRADVELILNNQYHDKQFFK